MNRPSLYAAFGDKGDLYLKTLQRYQRKSRTKTIELLADRPSLRVFLTRYYDGALEIYRAGGEDARGCYSISTAPAQATVDPAVREFLDESIRGTDAFLAGVIGEGARPGRDCRECRPCRAGADRHRNFAHHRGALARRGIAQATQGAGRRRHRS